MPRSSLAGVLAAAMLFVSAESTHAQPIPKVDLIDKVVPDALKSLANVCTSAIGVYTGALGIIDQLASIGTILGIFEPPMGPNITQLFDDLEKQLNSIAGELDWKISATARDERYGKAMSAFYGLMHAMQANELSDEILANADQTSMQVINEVMGPAQSAFMRTAAEDVTSGDWQKEIRARPVIENGAVYDWRVAVPELMQYLAIRISVMAVIDPNFRENGQFAAELTSYRKFLESTVDRMRSGVRCELRVGDVEPETGAADTAYVLCANIHTGGSLAREEFNVLGQGRMVTPAQIDQVKQVLYDRMPLGEMNDLIAQLGDLGGNQ